MKSAFLFICIHIVLSCISSSLDYNITSNYTWLAKWKYYYPSLELKMVEILSNKCLDSLKISELKDVESAKNNTTILAATIHVSNHIFLWWRNISRPKQMRVEPFLCDEPYMKKKPYFNNKGCENPAGYMSQSGPRCQIGYLKWICDQSRMEIDISSGNGFVLPESDHKQSDFIPPQPFLISVSNAYVMMCGQVYTQCGIIAMTTNCMAEKHISQMKRKFTKGCTHDLVKDNSSLQIGDEITCADSVPYSNKALIVQRIFVVAEADDTHIYHIHLEIIPRLVYHLEFLLANPDIKILVSCDTVTSRLAEVVKAKGLAFMEPYMAFIGLSMDRLVVHRHVYASKVYLPMEGGCQDPVYNTWQILHMRRIFMLKSNRNPDELGINWVAEKGRRKPVMMLIKRSFGATHTRNHGDLVRQWSDDFTHIITENLQKAFPSYSIQLFSDKNVTVMSSIKKQVVAVNNANVMIGIHGAGLANMIYMRPNSAVVEFAPFGNDGRCLLGGGPFSRLAAVMGHNYMIHHPKYEEYKWLRQVSEFNVTRFILHIRSFLLSIDMPL